MKNGVELIAIERNRQITDEMYTSTVDSTHTDGELAEAAAVYAGFATSIQVPIESVFSNNNDVHKLAEKLKNTDAVILIPKTHRWPWDIKYYKPTPNDRIKELTKAGALIAAEIDRLQNI